MLILSLSVIKNGSEISNRPHIFIYKLSVNELAGRIRLISSLNESEPRFCIKIVEKRKKKLQWCRPYDVQVSHFDYFCVFDNVFVNFG